MTAKRNRAYGIILHLFPCVQADSKEVTWLGQSLEDYGERARLNSILESTSLLSSATSRGSDFEYAVKRAR